MINRQARAITGMLKSTPIGPLVREASLAPAEVLLEARQLRYTTRLLGLPESHPAKKILPGSLREGDQHVQPGEQTPGNRQWAESSNRGLWSLGQHLARQLANILPADPSEGFESTIQTSSSQFPGRIEVSSSAEALAAARALPPGLTSWSDGSGLDNGRCGAGIAWQEPGGAWKTGSRRPITVLLDSQATIARLQHTQPGPSQALAIQAHTIAKKLKPKIANPPYNGFQDTQGLKEMREPTRQQSRRLISLQEGAQKRYLSRFPREPERRPFRYKSRDSLPGNSANNPNGSNQPTDHRETGGSTPWLQRLRNTWQAVAFN